jgi:gliding motility-associated-like protein
LIVTVDVNCVEPSKIFTPNNDGLYDNWIAYTGSCVKMVEANVYDRNGNLVYHSSDYKNNWNGNRNGKALPDATYYYVLKITDINGLAYVRKGSVAIIR